MSNVVYLNSWKARQNNTSHKQKAYSLYLQASKLDTSSETMMEAQNLYKMALTLDPKLSLAYTNLGNIRFRLNDFVGAENSYQQAVAISPDQPEALYNLGYIALDQRNYCAAWNWLKRAIASDPTFADAHFNLAMTLDHLNRHGEARVHWRRFLHLEPSGNWADVARRNVNIENNGVVQ